MKIVFFRKILEYLLVFDIILEFYTPYRIFPIVNHVILILPILILLFLILISRYSILKKFNIYILLYLGSALVPMLVINEHNYLSYILRFILILPLLWIYLSLRKETGLENYISIFLRYSNTIVVIACVSLIMWILCSILKIIPPTGMMPFEWSQKTYSIPTYWGIYFETQSVFIFGQWIFRNTGIFNEGPMYNMVLCMAFTIELFIRHKKSKFRLWILSITIITTFTTTGQLFLIGIICWKILRKISSKYRVLLMVTLPIVLCVGYIFTSEIIENKIETGGEESIDLRTEDIEYCIEAGLEHPILGVGMTLGEGEGLWKGKQLGRSNSIFAIFARGGLYTLTLYIGVLLIIPCLYYLKFKNTKWLLTMLCFFFVFSITSSYLKYLTFLFMAWGLSNIDLKRWKSYQ